MSALPTPFQQAPVWLVLCCLLTMPPAAAQEPPFSISEAVREALAKRPLLESDSERIDAARARVKQARSGLLPRIDAQASATDGPLGSPAMGLGGLVGTPIKRHTGASVNLVQTLLDFGRTHNTVRARRADVAANQAALRADQNLVALQVRQAYFQVLQARRLLRISDQILEQRRLVARQAETLRENGLGTRLDVDLAEVNVAKARLTSTRARGDVETAFAALTQAVGRPIPVNTPLVDAVGDDPGAPLPAEPVPTLEEAYTVALRDRPELRQSAAQEQSFQHQASAARAAKRPILMGVGSVGKIHPVPLFEAGDKPWAVGLSLSLPLYTGGAVEAQIEEANRGAGAARASREELAGILRQQVASALANLATANESVPLAQLQVAHARDALSLATQRFQVQLGSIVELSQAQVAHADAEFELLRARYDRELALAALDFAMGRAPLGTAEGKR